MDTALLGIEQPKVTPNYTNLPLPPSVQAFAQKLVKSGAGRVIYDHIEPNRWLLRTPQRTPGQPLDRMVVPSPDGGCRLLQESIMELFGTPDPQHPVDMPITLNYRDDGSATGQLHNLRGGTLTIEYTQGALRALGFPKTPRELLAP